MWIFEMFMTAMGENGMWVSVVSGDEETCRERYDWHLENLPELSPQINLRNTETDPEPPPAPDLEE